MQAVQKTFDKQYYLDMISEVRQQAMQLRWSKHVLIVAMIPAGLYSLVIFQHGLVWVGLCLMIAALVIGVIAVLSASALLPAQHHAHIQLYLLGIIIPFVNLFFLTRMFGQYNAGINSLMHSEHKLHLKIRALKEALYGTPTPHPIPQPLLLPIADNPTDTDIESLVFDFSTEHPTQTLIKNSQTFTASLELASDQARS